MLERPSGIWPSVFVTPAVFLATIRCAFSIGATLAGCVLRGAVALRRVTPDPLAFSGLQSTMSDLGLRQRVAAA